MALKLNDDDKALYDDMCVVLGGWWPSNTYHDVKRCADAMLTPRGLTRDDMDAMGLTLPVKSYAIRYLRAKGYVVRGIAARRLFTWRATPPTN